MTIKAIIAIMKSPDLNRLEYTITNAISDKNIYIKIIEFISILERSNTIDPCWKKNNIFVDELDSRGSSQTCSNCRSLVRMDLLLDKLHSCLEYHYEIDIDIASAQEICDRELEKAALVN